AAVCGGLLATLFGLGHLSMPVLVGAVLLVTALLLIMGQYRALDQFIKLLSVVLLVTVLVAFAAVLLKGPSYKGAAVAGNSIWEGAGLTLLISLLGWMPAGMEASVMNSVWNIEKVRSAGYRPSLAQTMFDFNLGYALTALLAFAFLVIGAFTVYGSGQQLGGNSVQFTNQLLQVFTESLGAWSYPVITIAAFGALYGTLITVWDAYARCWSLSLTELRKQGDTPPSDFQYALYLLLIGIGGFLLFKFFSASLLQILEAATITAFITAPVIGYLNLKAILSPAVAPADRPGKGELLLARIGLIFMAGFSIYYLYDLLIVPRFS
ncbi:MAG: hypothetical protein KDC44_19270, partial [Phaeodactylibacter sp.]|nr:hypothetical protein [Phaeodactylibacter sp.]